MEIKIDTNLAELPIWINKHVLKQAIFASSVALYDTAVDVKEALIDSLPSDFIIRNGWVAKGIRIKPTGSKAIRATGKGIAGMEARVGTIDSFMAMQELGGKKTGKHNSVAIPVREPVTEIMDKEKWPGALLKKPGFFTQQRPDGRTLVFQRLGRKRYPIKLKYAIMRSVKIPPRWGMRDKSSAVVKARYEENFDRAFEMALATARK